MAKATIATLAFIAAVILVPSFGRAECVPEKMAAAIIAARNPDARRVVDLDGERAARFIAVWNAIPPQTTIVATRVWVYDSDAKTTVLIVLLGGGCLKAVDEQPKPFFRRFFPDVLLGQWV